MKTVQILIIGKVQGVFFRKYTQQKALSLNLFGWVRNRTDGSVELQACGEESNLQLLIDWCHKGSPMSKVKDVIVEWGDYPDCDSDAFEIRPTI